MNDDARFAELHAVWERAVERDKPADAVKACLELERLAASDPLWSHRLGESYRRMGKMKDAEEAFVRATDRYAAKGFLPRAIAMAKLVVSLNPARTDVLARVQPKDKPLVVVPPPLPLPLAPAKDAKHDEVRFADAHESSISLTIEDVSLITELPSADLVADPSVSMPPISSLPIPSEPPMDRLATMTSFRLFAGLSRDALLALSDATELVEFVPEAMVIVKDEPAFALFLVIDGQARVEMPGSAPIPLREGDVFGEACLLQEGERQANIRASSHLMTLRITKKKLDALTKEHAEIGEALFEMLARRLVTNLMQTSPLFTLFEPRMRLELSQMFEVRRAARGLVLAERGRKSDALYILLAGHLVADSAGAGSGTPIEVARGSAFGHAALLGNAPSQVTVRAETEAVVLRLPAQRFSALAVGYPPALAYLAEIADEPVRASLLPD